MRMARGHLCTLVALMMSPLASCTNPQPGPLEGYSSGYTPARVTATRGDKNQDINSLADDMATKAVSALSRGDYTSASQLINQALQLRIDRSYFHLINGLCYHMRGKAGDRTAFDLAEQGYTQAIHFDESNWMAYYFRGRLHLDLGQFDSAMDDLANALLFRPDDTELLSSFAYAAYRSGRPDIAAGALGRVEHASKAAPPSVWRNYAMVMAALGNSEAAVAYIDRYQVQGGSSHDVAYLRQRVKDWDELHASDGMFQLAQFGGSGQPQYGSSGQYSSGTDPAGGAFNGGSMTVGGGQNGGVKLGGMTQADLTTAKGTEDKMVVIDVVMISTEDTISTTKGVNLLNGLSLEFGGVSGSNTVGGYSFLQDKSNQGASTSITRAITIPAVSYTLNILNANNQRSEVLSRPTLIGLAGKQSDFFSGLELNAAAVAGGGSVLAGGISIGGGQAINIQKEIGVRLGVIPTVLDDGRLKLAVNFERTFLENPSNDVNFTFKLETDKDQVSANVIMRYGETLILGGLSEKETQYDRDGVPGLQDTPGLQYLFSNETKSDYQKSTLILLTPRPPQYVYQPDKAREAYEKSLSEDERPIANLTARYSDWFRPYPNWASVFHHLQENGLYREFRTGDVDLESWSSMQSLSDRLNQALDFLRY